jgi:hypothetical protein
VSGLGVSGHDVGSGPEYQGSKPHAATFCLVVKWSCGNPNLSLAKCRGERDSISTTLLFTLG